MYHIFIASSSRLTASASQVPFFGRDSDAVRTRKAVWPGLYILHLRSATYQTNWCINVTEDTVNILHENSTDIITGNHRYILRRKDAYDFKPPTQTCSKSFHLYTMSQKKVAHCTLVHKIINKDPTSPQMCCYTTLWNLKSRKTSNNLNQVSSLTKKFQRTSQTIGLS